MVEQEIFAEAIHKVPRSVYFKDGIAVGVGIGGWMQSHDKMVVMELPSDHYDFIGLVDVVGKSIEEIEKDITFNLFDGQGIISPRMAEVWAN